jgi:hypothetical protein
MGRSMAQPGQVCLEGGVSRWLVGVVGLGAELHQRPHAARGALLQFECLRKTRGVQPGLRGRMAELRPLFPAVVFWLGFWFWWEHPGAALGRFFASLAVVGTWGGQGAATKWGGRRRPAGHAAVPLAVAAPLTFAPGRAAGAVFFQGGTRRDKWLDRAGRVCPSWARKN